MLVESTTFVQLEFWTFRGSGQARNKWIKHIQQNQLSYAEKSPTDNAVFCLHFSHKWNLLSDLLQKMVSYSIHVIVEYNQAGSEITQLCSFL